MGRNRCDHRIRVAQVTFKTSSTGSVTKRIEYDYDAADRRIAKRVYDGSSTLLSTERFVYDGSDVVLVFGTSSLTNRYLHGPETDQLFADEDAVDGLLWALADHQQTVRDLVDSTGTVQNHIQYDSFGEITGQSNAALTSLYAYTGQHWGADAEMYYYDARWYDPGVGRFISEDPSGLSPDANLYRYVENSPWNYTDPTGWTKASPQVNVFRAIASVIAPTATSIVSSVATAANAFLSASVGAPASSNVLGRVISYQAERAWAGIQDVAARNFQGIVEVGQTGYRIANHAVGAWSRDAVNLAVEGLDFRQAGGFLDLVARGSQLQSSMGAVDQQIQQLDGARESWTSWLGLSLSADPAKYPKTAEQVTLEQQYATLQSAYRGLQTHFAEDGFAELEVTGFGQGFNSEMRRDAYSGRGFDSAIQAYQQSRTRTHSGGLQPSVSPFDVGLLGGAIAKSGYRIVAGVVVGRGATGGGPMSRGAQLRAKHGDTYGEYAHFRSQGFSPAQAKYLTEPYQGAGHHFPIPQRTARDWGLPRVLRDSPFNVLRPSGISRGRFYELHYKVDPHFNNANFPNQIGGSWTGSQLGLERYSPPLQWWYATPGPSKAAAGAAAAGGVGAGAYWLGSNGE